MGATFATRLAQRLGRHLDALQGGGGAEPVDGATRESRDATVAGAHQTPIGCDCWPQDVDVRVCGPSETPQAFFKHVGNGVCEKYEGCLPLVGADAVPYDTMTACTNAYAECACLDCDPLPDPVLVPTGTATGTPCPDQNCVPGTNLLDIQEWYPMDRGQAPGERALNWYDGQYSCNPYYRGQSTFNYGGVPEGLPASYKNQCVDYFLNWPCPADDEQCHRYQQNHFEIISERRDESGHVTHLDHWGHNRESSWHVFYSTENGDGVCGCTNEDIAPLPDAPATQQARREPEVIQFPCHVGQSINTPLRCGAKYTNGPNGRGFDLKHLTSTGL